ncbi:unannotated protein [freshwater metagenome]|uniref:Unannotated protein n=1 Tax=freshwater metagenome TaxID=449393 RepID=A0A6J7SJH3_9ZZZZ
MWVSNSAELARQLARNCFWSATALLSSSAVSGERSPASCSSAAASSRHSTGELAATPRGSKETKSNALVSSEGKAAAAEVRNSRPDPPGPPGLMTSEPIRSDADPVDGWRMRASSVVGPEGLAGSMGTCSVAHSKPAAAARSSAQLVQVSGCCSEEGGTDFCAVELSAR